MNNQNRTIVGGGMYDRFMNYMLPHSRNKLRDGEVHPPVWTGNAFEIPSYLGPGTNLSRKIREGVEPITKTDKVAQAHDIRYSLATSVEDVRNADLKMINKLNQLEENNEDYKFNIYTGKIPIKAKMMMEDIGLFSPDKFTSLKLPKDVDAKQAKLTALEAEGYGRTGGSLFGSLNNLTKKLASDNNELTQNPHSQHAKKRMAQYAAAKYLYDSVGKGKSNKWVHHVKQYQQKHKCTYKEALKGARKTYTK